MAHPYRPGDVLVGRYRVERVIGEGGMGVVLEAEHLELGERVAVKLLLPEAARISDAVPRFQREARAASRIPSEHVARVMDVGALQDGTPFLVMEYVEGRDLSAEVDARGPLPIEESVGYVLQAAVGVAEAHALGIVHRDLKPSNLFLARLPSGRTLVKVLDFGIAKLTDDADVKKLTQTFSALGSIAYMSPEQLRAAKEVDARADVWAFGIVLFELLTARMPFEGETLTAISASITVDQPHLLRAYRPEAPEELEAVIMSCLEKDRENRTPSLAALAKGLEPFGGRNASVLVARILDAHPESPAVDAVPSRASLPALLADPSARAASAASIAEIAATRPAWTTSDEPEPPTLKVWRGKRRAIVVGAVGALALGALAFVIAVYGMRRGPDQTTAPIGSQAPGVAIATPAAESTASAAFASREHSESEPAPSATTPSTTATRNAPSSDRGASKKSKEPSRKVKKPLFTNL